MPPKKFYAVKVGKNGPCIYTNWSDCSANVTGFPGAVFKGFVSKRDAEQFISDNEKLDKTRIFIPQDTGEITKTDYIHVKIPLPRNVTASECVEIFKKRAAEKGDCLKDVDFRGPLKAYTDGSCTKIGTPGASAGSGIYYPELGIGVSVQVPGKQTNNRGELWAAICSVHFILALCQKHEIPPPKELVLYTDSTYTQNTIKNNGKLNLDLCNALIKTSRCIKLGFKKVLAHSGDPHNDTADELAKYYALG